MMKRFLDDRSVDCLPVLTKIDKLRRTARHTQLLDAARALGLNHPGGIIPFSAKSEEGREGLLAAIGAYVRGDRARPVPR